MADQIYIELLCFSCKNNGDGCASYIYGCRVNETELNSFCFGGNILTLFLFFPIGIRFLSHLERSFGGPAKFFFLLERRT